MAIFCEYKHPTLGYSIIVEDDDHVAYGYLLKDSAIISDVWLYNSDDSPIKPEWHTRSNKPFANPLDYVLDIHFAAITGPNDVVVEWADRNEEVLYADVFIRGEWIARLAPGKSPGWNRNVKKSGPLALVLSVAKPPLDA